LVNDTLYAAVARTLYRAHDEPAAHEAIEGIEHFDKVINVDQSSTACTASCWLDQFGTGRYVRIEHLCHFLAW
jgi:excinuclease UvrABC ATPase subunit